MTKRDKIFWLIWLAFVVALIWVCCRQSAHAKSRQWISQGDGANDLIRRSAVVLPPVERWIYPPYYFAVTAEDKYAESLFSNEVVYTNKMVLIGGKLIVSNSLPLAWDYPKGSNVTFTVYKGRESGVYTNSYPAGTNLSLIVPLSGPRLTNLVVIITSQNATNLQWATALGKNWSLLGATNYTATNPPTRMWRGLGSSKSTPPKLTIKATWQ